MKNLMFLSIAILLSLSVSKASNVKGANESPYPIFFQDIQNLDNAVLATIECRETTTIKFHIVHNNFTGKFRFYIGNYSSNLGFTVTGNGTSSSEPEYHTLTIPTGKHQVYIDRSYPISGSPYVVISEVSGNNYVGGAHGQPYLNVRTGW